MKLESFRVQNYKKIRDTDWISCGDLTCLVGKNESGKSAIFRGLSKLNPSDGEKYDGLKEFPRRRYTDEFHSQDWPAASGRFELTQEEKSSLINICAKLDTVSHVIFTRYYSWHLAIEFEPEPNIEPVIRSGLIKAITDAEQKIRKLTAPEGKGEELGVIKTRIVGELNSMKETLKQSVENNGEEEVSEDEIDNAIKIIEQSTNEDWQQELFSPLLKDFENLKSESLSRGELNQAKKWVEKHIPQFIYFDRYDVIDSAIHFPTFVQQLGSDPYAPRVRTTRCLFEHVGLDINKLASLGRHQGNRGPEEEIRRYVDERAIHFSSASNAMTKKFADWWEQRRHQFRYQADGDYFRVWVSDDLDPSEIELDQRSLGMQYFFSFYIVFLVEAKEAHRNSILLLDEPGLHMHGTAQAKIIKFLERLSKENQVLYTTHSPFMVDGDHIERVRTVYEDDAGTTRVSEDVWPRDKDALFPLQAALGYQLTQSLFISKRQLIVEGITDYWILKAFDQTLALKNMTNLSSDTIIVPSAGLSKLLPLASLLMGHNIEVVALLDGDEPARKEGKKLVEKLLTGETNRCLFVGDFVQSMDHAELEDIFPEQLYLQAVKEAYPHVRLSFNADEKSLSEVLNKLQALFERKSLGKYEKWRVAAILRDWMLDTSERIPIEVFSIIEEIFDRVNKTFTTE